MDLMAANPFLAGSNQVGDLQPLVCRDVRAFENSTDLGRELLLALQATPQPRSRGLATNDRDPLIATAVRANRAVRPYDAFQLRDGGELIVEIWRGQGAHGPTP